MRVGAATSVGRVRETNEDAYWVGEHCLVVCDGMGGHQGGEIASEMAVDVIRNYDFLMKDPEEEIRSAIQQAHEEIRAAADTNDHLRGMGTTLTMCLFVPNQQGVQMFIGHVGDSRAYVHIHDQLQQMTSDHSVVGELLRQGSLAPDEAAAHPKRHVLSQALGVGVIEVELIEYHLPKGCKVLLCTDGLTDVVGDDELKKAMDLRSHEDIARELVRRANDLGGPDNIKGHRRRTVLRRGLREAALWELVRACFMVCMCLFVVMAGE